MGKRENKVETYLDEQVELIGGVTRKYVSPAREGVADRLVILPGGRIIFVELKTIKGVRSTAQIRERNKMLGLGCESLFIAGKTEVDIFIIRIKQDLPVC